MDLRLTRVAEGGKPRRKEGAGWPAARALGARARSPSGPMEVAWEGVLGVNGGVSPPKADNRAERPRAAEGGGWARREAGRFPGFTKERRGRLSEDRWRRQLSAPPPRRRPGAAQNCGE